MFCVNVALLAAEKPEDEQPDNLDNALDSSSGSCESPQKQSSSKLKESTPPLLLQSLPNHDVSVVFAYLA